MPNGATPSPRRKAATTAGAPPNLRRMMVGEVDQKLVEVITVGVAAAMRMLITDGAPTRPKAIPAIKDGDSAPIKRRAPQATTDGALAPTRQRTTVGVLVLTKAIQGTTAGDPVQTRPKIMMAGVALLTRPKATMVGVVLLTKPEEMTVGAVPLTKPEEMTAGAVHLTRRKVMPAVVFGEVHQLFL